MYSETSLADTAGSSEEDVRILRFSDVVRRTGMSKSGIYGRLRRNDFPGPIQIGPRSVGFVEREVNHWLHDLVAKNRKTA